ncbi:MAG: DNA-directed RNA polymerase subunit F [Methanobacteriota archaeon]|nr:MAG: DNA-directed RNA polymerase subunit F [Euryarchaeota archaeon]
MIGRKIHEESPITMAEVAEILSKKDSDKIYEQNIALDHLQKFTRLNAKDARALVEEVLKLNEKFKPHHAVKVADLLPEDEGDVKAIFAKERFSLNKEEIKALLDVVAKYR